MKKIYQIIVLCVMSIVLASCGGSSTPANEETSVDNKDYKTPADNDDFSAAHEVIKNLMKDYEEKFVNMKPFDEDDVMNLATLYMDAASYVYCAETRYLFTSEEENAERRLKVLINEFPHIGKIFPEGYYNEDEEHNLFPCKLYSVYAKANNVFAECFLNMAISNGNKQLAYLALSHFLEVPNVKKEEREKSLLIKNDVSYSVYYHSEEKEAAQKKYDDAVEQGLFSE